jgi:gluconokinase
MLCMIVLIMGTTASGKTTIGRMLAGRLGWDFADADDFHPPANVAKMSQGIPLTDADRAPWLQTLHDKIVAWTAESRNVVLACSALKQAYRDELLVGSLVKIVYLRGSYELFSQRVQTRRGHFAKVDILAGQFRDLEEPTEAITVDARHSPREMVDQICAALSRAHILPT